MILTEFESYKSYSTAKTASGMSDSTYKTLKVYVTKYSQFTNEYTFKTFAKYLETIDLHQNSKAFLANSMGRFLWLKSYIDREEFDKLRQSYRFKYRSWSHQHISPQQLSDVFENAWNGDDFLCSRNYVLLALLAITGQRISQITSINRQDLILDTDPLQITVKEIKRNDNDASPETRVIKLPHKVTVNKMNVHDLLVDYISLIEVLFPDNNALILNSQGQRLTNRAVQQMVKRWSDGVCEITPHSFRHEAVTRAVNKFGLATGAILAGHKSLSTTMRYTNPEYIDISEAYESYDG